MPKLVTLYTESKDTEYTKYYIRDIRPESGILTQLLASFLNHHKISSAQLCTIIHTYQSATKCNELIGEVNKVGKNCPEVCL